MSASTSNPTIPVSHAAMANAVLCHLVAEAHGRRPDFGPEAWTCPERTPPLYPDAVTLRPGVDPDELLAKVDAGPGCSVKDSFYDLDLEPFGFRVLFEADWMRVEPGPINGGNEVSLVSERVDDADSLALWEEGWRRSPTGRGAGPGRTFPPSLLDLSVLTFLSFRDPSAPSTIAGGAVVSAGPGGAQLSNVWGEPYRDVKRRALHDGQNPIHRRPLFFMESIEAEVLPGTLPVGEVRVWIR
jgi:hypothetical protein